MRNQNIKEIIGSISTLSGQLILEVGYNKEAVDFINDIMILLIKITETLEE